MLRLVIAAVIVVTLFAPAAFADEEEQKQEQEKQPQQEKSPPTAIQKLLKELKAVVARETAQPEHDEDLLKDLEKLIEIFEKVAKKEAAEAAKRAEGNKVRLEDLTEEDRKALREEMRKKLAEEKGEAGEEGGEGGGRESWAERDRRRRIERALEDVKLSEEQQAAVEELVGEFITDAYASTRNGDVGHVNDLKKDLEKRLRREVGGRKARQIINNINRSLPRRGWGR